MVIIVKKVLFWIWICALAVFIVDWGVVGVMLLNGNYEIKAGDYIGLAFIITLLISGVGYKFMCKRCPHCHKVILSSGEYCSHCGNSVNL